MREVDCILLKQKLPGLPAAPFPGALGQRIYEQVSLQAFQSWMAHQTMLINENRLNLTEPTAKEFLRTEMKKFFFGEGSEKPPGYIEEK